MSALLQVPLDSYSKLLSELGQVGIGGQLQTGVGVGIGKHVSENNGRNKSQ